MGRKVLRPGCVRRYPNEISELEPAPRSSSRAGSVVRLTMQQRRSGPAGPDRLLDLGLPEMRGDPACPVRKRRSIYLGSLSRGSGCFLGLKSPQFAPNSRRLRGSLVSLPPHAVATEPILGLVGLVWRKEVERHANPVVWRNRQRRNPARLSAGPSVSPGLRQPTRGGSHSPLRVSPGRAPPQSPSAATYRTPAVVLVSLGSGGGSSPPSGPEVPADALARIVSSRFGE